MEKKYLLILTVLSISLIIVGVLFWNRNKSKKWSCVEGTCERIIGGDYESLQDCQQSCKIKKKEKKEEKEEKEKNLPKVKIIPY